VKVNVPVTVPQRIVPPETTMSTVTSMRWELPRNGAMSTPTCSARSAAESAMMVIRAGAGTP
jgi:hypothetical protein